MFSILLIVIIVGAMFMTSPSDKEIISSPGELEPEPQDGL